MLVFLTKHRYPVVSCPSRRTYIQILPKRQAVLTETFGRFPQSLQAMGVSFRKGFFFCYLTMFTVPGL
jgi:hypothetical protein